MIRLFNLQSLLLIMLMLGCASSGTKTTSTTTNLPKSTRRAELPQGHYFLESFRRASSAECPRNLDAVMTKSWKWMATRASACAFENKWNMVERLGHALLEKDYHSPWGPYFLSLHAEAQHNMRLAHWMVDLALRKDAELSVLHYQKAKLFWYESQFQQAVQSAKTAVKLDPNMAGAHLILGDNALATRDFSKAVLHFDGVLRIEAKNLSAHMGLVSAKVLQRESKDALQAINRAVGYYPREPQFYLQRAYVMEALDNDYEHALIEYKRIAKMQFSPEQISQIGLNDKIRDLENLVSQTTPNKAAAKRGVANEEVKK